MKFSLTNIDPYNCSIDELGEEIKKLTNLAEEYNNIQNSIKVFINSIYGAIGSAWYECYNVNIAEAITLQGQDLSKYASKVLDEYFLNEWHLDKELHQKLNLSYVNKVNEKTFTIYTDTDSVYFSFESILKSCDWKESPIEFILKLKEYKLNSYLKCKFEEYAKRFNTENLQDLELEKISYSCIMVAKKKYILDLAWKLPNVYYKPQEKIKPVGIEIVQGSTPKYARKALKEMVKVVCESGKSLQYADVVKKLKEVKKDYLLQHPEDLAKTQAIGDYEKYCLEDKKEIRLAEKTGQNVRSAAVYNHIILNSKWKTKYNIIKTGDKVKYYYTKQNYTNSNEEVFGFLPSNFPYEFAPPVDYDLQFSKTIVEPFNRIMTAVGFNQIPGNLIYSRSLF